MNYKEYKDSIKRLNKDFTDELTVLRKKLNSVRQRIKRSDEDEEACEREERKLEELIEAVKNRNKREVEIAKRAFAEQDNPVKVGDIIWTNTKCMRVEEVTLAAFDYPMFKYFGLQLTMHGLPAVIQKEFPHGGIYQKDVVSVNGKRYSYTKM